MTHENNSSRKLRGPGLSGECSPADVGGRSHAGPLISIVVLPTSKFCLEVLARCRFRGAVKQLLGIAATDDLAIMMPTRVDIKDIGVDGFARMGEAFLAPLA